MIAKTPFVSAAKDETGRQSRTCLRFGEETPASILQQGPSHARRDLPLSGAAYQILTRGSGGTYIGSVGKTSKGAYQSSTLRTMPTTR